MIFQILLNEDFPYYQRLIILAFMLFVVFGSLTIHEVAHGYASYALGDDTAKDRERLTLNPIKHMDFIGALCMLVFKFGWAKPVPINLKNFRKPKRDFALTAIAGPTSNIILSVISGESFS